MPEDIESKYAFVTLASARAEQLQTGALPRVKNTGGRKFTVVAQEEVAKGLVEPFDPEAEGEGETGEEE